MMRLWLLVLGVVLLVRPASAADPSELASPVKIQAAGKPIDADLGHAAPCFADLKGDGIMSLLVGQGADGKLRIYPSANSGSQGKRAQPRLDSLNWFKDGQPGGRVPAAQDSGFIPHVADLDGDGNPDVLSGSANGDLYFFRGTGDGKFADGVTLKGKDNLTINVGKFSTVFAFDWKDGGLLDLIVGTSDGSVYLIPNEGSATKYSFGKPKKLEADGKPIQASLGHAHPVVADWDADGKPDLLVGTGAGSVLWFRNIGTRAKPKLDAAATLVAESPLVKNPTANLGAGQWGVRAKICVVDWNGDGRLDLLLGDVNPEQHQPTLADRDAERKARHEVAKLQKDYQNAMRKLQDLQKPVAKETPKSIQEREKKLHSLQTSAARMQKDQALAQINLNKLVHPPKFHGYVWLFLRQSSSGSASSKSEPD